MDKEDILKKSRAEQRDEGEEHAMAEGAKWGFFGMCVLYFILVALTVGLEGGDFEALLPLHALFWSGRGLADLGKASVNHEKALRFSGIVQTVAGVIALLLYFAILCVRLEKRG